MTSRLLLFIILSLNWIPSSAQSSDSLRLYSAPIWQIQKLVAIAQKAKVCDTLVRYQETVIRLGIRAQASSDSLLTLTQAEVKAVRALAVEWSEKYDIQVQLTAVAIKQKRKWIIATVVAGLVIIGETVLFILSQ